MNKACIDRMGISIDEHSLFIVMSVRSNCCQSKTGSLLKNKFFVNGVIVLQTRL